MPGNRGLFENALHNHGYACSEMGSEFKKRIINMDNSRYREWVAYRDMDDIMTDIVANTTVQSQV